MVLITSFCVVELYVLSLILIKVQLTLFLDDMDDQKYAQSKSFPDLHYLRRQKFSFIFDRHEMIYPNIP